MTIRGCALRQYETGQDINTRRDQRTKYGQISALAMLNYDAILGLEKYWTLLSAFEEGNFCLQTNVNTIE